MKKIYIPRPKYIERIKPFVGKEIIKVFTGQRRVGKSCIMAQIADTIKQDIIYIDKEKYEFEPIKNYHDLTKYILDKTRGAKTSIFIDEVQEIEGFEKAIRDFAKSGKYDVYISGSNSELLSSDLAGKLSGRYVEIRVHALSYEEFLLFHKLEKGTASLEKYIRYGGLPYLVNLKLENEQVFGYLKNVFDAVILKDVVSRFEVRNVNFLGRLVEYLADNLGSLVSAKKISDFLKSQNINLSPNTVLNYLSFLASSFFIAKCQRMDIVGKKIFEIGEKYYFEDLGLRHSILNFKQVDINKILENLVYSRLLDLGYKVFVGQIDHGEVDFVAEKAGEKIYVQTAYLISSKKVEKREFGSLMDIKDNYKKIVVTMDEMAGGNVKGIIHMHILDFLTNDF
ncbi:ATP-binding protein [Candidatus Gottesmanbacteria bacterium]|nr:ATP-binding protein [Candidatus Gottesmanbacteria bacterium]